MIETGAHRLIREAMKLARFMGYTQREHEANLASLYYFGFQYAHLAPWGTEGCALRDKAPPYRIRLTKTVTDTFVSHLFGEERQPTFSAAEGDFDEALADVIRDSQLTANLPEVGRLGGLHGTVAIGFHVIEGRLDLEVMKAANCKPRFGRDDRLEAVRLGVDFDDLLELDERWRTYEDEGDGREPVEVFHRRLWTTTHMHEYVPIRGPVVSGHELEWREDLEATHAHNLGFVPAVWVRNARVADDIDGQPLMGSAEFEVEDDINYTIGQAGRGVRYNQEPTLVITGTSLDPSKSKIRRGANNTLQMEPDPMYESIAPKAELLEMAGAGQHTAMDYVDKLRDYLFMVTRVYKHDPERAAGALSGVAMQRLKEPLVGLVKLVRPEYEAGLVLLLQKMLIATKATPGDMKNRPKIDTRWPPVIAPTVEDLAAMTGAVSMLMAEGLLNRRQAIEMMQAHLGIQDVQAHIDELDEADAQLGTPGAPSAEPIIELTLPPDDGQTTEEP